MLISKPNMRTYMAKDPIPGRMCIVGPGSRHIGDRNKFRLCDQELMGEPEKTLIEFLDEFPELSRRQRLGFGENVCARPEGY